MKWPSAAACWRDSRGLPSPPPAPSQDCGEACVWLSGTMEQRGLGEATGTCLTEITAVMNQAPETTSTSSLHKYPWAPKPCLAPQGAHAGACYWEAGRNALGVEVGEGGTGSQHLSSGRGVRDWPLRAGRRKGFP